MINETIEVMHFAQKGSKPISGKIQNKLLQATLDLGKLMPAVNDKTAPRILYLLRDVYNICTQILQERGVKNEIKSENKTI